MCICVSADELMCRVGPEIYQEALEKNGTRAMINHGRTMNGYVYVAEEVAKSKADFDYWIQHCLAFNKFAKPSKPKPKK